ncbi:RodZ domain-containing protein [Salipaludibacillus sp. CF4.18]|uniref:helix-turn-helix domain-containing protein n=1 Tax=Salipaludibacillus sp. CF4.18 TaxID=3373081 RepID=UPI003EE7E84D
MSELGIRLKSAREEKGYTLEEMQKVTKIQKRYLMAIEEGDFSKMPGEFYARAFVKSYSEAVGLDPDMIFDEHKEELPQPKRERVDLPPRVNRSKPRTVRRKSRFASFIPTIVLVIFLLVIACGIWLFNQGNSDDASVPREQQQEQPSLEITDSVNENETVDGNEEAVSNASNEEDSSAANGSGNESNANSEENNEEEEEEVAQSMTLDSIEGNRSFYQLSGTDSFEIRIEVTGDSWIGISNSDGDSLHEGPHTQGDTVSLDVSDESHIIFNLGNVTTADIYINDELLEYQNDDAGVRQYVEVELES